MNDATAATGPLAASDAASAGRSRLFLALVIGALVLGLLRRTMFGLDSPLWLDETYTGAIAIQPTLRGLVLDCLSEVGGPVYYSLMWCWEKLFGAGNLALRFPSLLFGALAPVLIFAKGHPDRFTRLFWAALAALWVPSFFYATEARSYALLFLMGTGQIILFMRMLARPSLRNALYWAGLSSLFLLTHYHSALVTGFQGLAYLWYHRKEALRTWPAGLLFAPAAAWMAFHLPLVVRFSTPEVAWQKLLGPADILRLPFYLIGLPGISWMLLSIVGIGVLWEVYLRWRHRTGSRIDRAEAAAVAASLLSLAIVFGFGFLRPNFTPRYLMPFMPGLLLGAAIWIRVLSHRVKLLPWLALGSLILFGLWEARWRSTITDWRSQFNWEYASRDLIDQNPRRLIFTWDNPTSVITSPRLMARVASFFFDRAGRPVPTLAPTLAGRGDVEPNASLLKVADRPGDAIIWIYDLQVDRTLASRYPPALPKLDPSLTCRNYGRDPHGVIACTRRGAP